MIKYHQNKDVYVIGFYPLPETDAGNRLMVHEHYWALYFTYNVNVLLIDRPNQMISLSSHTWVALEQKTPRSVNLKDFDHPEKTVYVVGNNEYPNPGFSFNIRNRVYIDVPNRDHPLYGCQAAAIALNDRYMKNGSNL